MKRELAPWRTVLLSDRPEEWSQDMSTAAHKPPPRALDPADRAVIAAVLRFVGPSRITRGPVSFTRPAKENRQRAEVYLIARGLGLAPAEAARHFGLPIHEVNRILRRCPELVAAAYLRARHAGALDEDGRVGDLPPPVADPAPRRRRTYIRHPPPTAGGTS